MDAYDLIDVRPRYDVGFEVLVTVKEHVEEQRALIRVNGLTENIVEMPIVHREPRQWFRVRHVRRCV